MSEIKCDKSGHGYEYFDLETKDGTFRISFENNLDSYWAFKPNVNFLDSEESYEVEITKENYFLYLEVEDLYESIKTGKIKTGRVYDDDGIIEMEQSEIDYIYQDDSIYFLSDDFTLEDASSFRIIKEDDLFRVVFTKSHSKEYFNSFSVRIRNSGCRYGYFHIPFMNLYNNLVKDSKEEYHQIHLEEYVYKKKLEKKGKK